MRVLIVGSGGREHALAWGCARHPSQPQILCAPGNAGTAEIATNVAVGATDAAGIAQLARDRQVDLVVVGPDAALAAGVADACREAGIAVFGASAAATRIESSKRFAKELMDRAGVPTARWRAASREGRSDLFDFVLELDGRCVVKADGLALGKGVTVCDSRAEATTALAACLNDRQFGAAGDVVVVEERLEGPELSVFALCDGERFHLLAPARDYKRALDSDHGPNTGGMGAYAPAETDPGLVEEISRVVVQPILSALAEAGTPFVGCLFPGLMLTPGGIRVLEVNARFGDPETQALVPLVGEALLDLLDDAAHGRLRQSAEVAPGGDTAVVVVAAAHGYPGTPHLGDPVVGVDSLDDDILCFHAGTARDAAGKLVTAGGRVLSVVGIGADVGAARQRAYENLGRIHFRGMWSRSDIAVIPAVARR